MTDLTQLIEAMPPEQREGALQVLDYLTRPLSRREIEVRLRGRGISSARASRIADAVAGWHIVAMVGPGEPS